MISMAPLGKGEEGVGLGKAEGIGDANVTSELGLGVELADLDGSGVGTICAKGDELLAGIGVL